MMQAAITPMMRDMWMESERRRVRVFMEKTRKRIWQTIRWWTPKFSLVLLREDIDSRVPPEVKEQREQRMVVPKDEPKPDMSHLGRALFCINVNWNRMGREAREKWLNELHDACAQMRSTLVCNYLQESG
jgi:hypothetical protein